MSASREVYLSLAGLHLGVALERLRRLAFDPSKHRRGKTTPKSRGGSFAPKASSGAEVPHYPTLVTSDFAGYLRETLIPDLKESGREATAEDFETAAHILETGKLPPGSGWKSTSAFKRFLTSTLIPDLRESGRDATADDFETVIRHFSKEDPDGVWRTVRGRRIFIREGEDLDSAIERASKYEKGREKKDWYGSGNVSKKKAKAWTSKDNQKYWVISGQGIEDGPFDTQEAARRSKAAGSAHGIQVRQGKNVPKDFR